MSIAWIRRRFFREVDAERARQLAKWGDQRHPGGNGHFEWKEKARLHRKICDAAEEDGRTTWDYVLLEEVYEALAEEDPAELRTELIQAAAVIAAWIEDIDRRDPE